MASVFVTSGTGENQQITAASDNKIRIFSSLAQLKQNLAAMREGEICATIEDEFSESAFDEVYERIDALEKTVDELLNNTGTGDGIAFTGTAEELEEALKIPEGEEGYIPANALVLVLDQDDEIGDFQ